MRVHHLLTCHLLGAPWFHATVIALRSTNWVRKDIQRNTRYQGDAMFVYIGPFTHSRGFSATTDVGHMVFVRTFVASFVGVEGGDVGDGAHRDCFHLERIENRMHSAM